MYQQRTATLRAYNILVLAALQSQHNRASALVLDLFTTFVSTYCYSLSGFQRTGPYQALQNSPLHTDVSGAYASIKLWLLLVQHASTQRRHSTEAFGENRQEKLPAGAAEMLTYKMIWNELWPPFERVMTVLEADTHAGTVTVSYH